MIKTRSIVQCPHCGFKTVEHMPSVRKVMTFCCPACERSCAADDKHCCVFCQYGSVPCPTAQAGKGDD